MHLESQFFISFPFLTTPYMYMCDFLKRNLHIGVHTLCFSNVFEPRQMRISVQGSGVYLNRERGCK